MSHTLNKSPESAQSISLKTEHNHSDATLKYHPHAGEEGGGIDHKGLMKATRVVVGYNLQRAGEQVEASLRRPEEICNGKDKTLNFTFKEGS